VVSDVVVLLDVVIIMRLLLVDGYWECVVDVFCWVYFVVLFDVVDVQCDGVWCMYVL